MKSTKLIRPVFVTREARWKLPLYRVMQKDARPGDIYPDGFVVVGVEDVEGAADSVRIYVDQGNGASSLVWDRCSSAHLHTPRRYVLRHLHRFRHRVKPQ